MKELTKAKKKNATANDERKNASANAKSAASDNKGPPAEISALRIKGQQWLKALK